MKSILNQLKKYQPEESNTTIIKVQDSTNVAAVFDIAEVATNVNVDVALLKSMPYTKFTGVLYPAELMALHYLQLHDETYANQIIEYFLSNTSPEEYFKKLPEAVDQTVKNLVYIRILIAALSDSKREFDYLPKSYIKVAAKLGMSHDISLRVAIDLLENTHKSSNFEQKILGRLIYMMAWKKLLNNQPVGFLN